ncbi:MAG: carbamoyl-phosphate synthase large subunit, partial [Halalkalicoccus sp.]|nr:carbamoyl-phosphate synthase large subunit [Halalkalicoccus sp.]
VEWDDLSNEELEAEYLETPSPDRPYGMFEAFSRGYSVEEVCELTGIYEWYVERYENVARAASAAQNGDFADAAEIGFTNAQVAAGIDASEASTIPQADGGAIDAVEGSAPERDFKQVDTCAGEFAASTPYYYSARARGDRLGRDEVQVDTDVESVVIVGGGPIRIGQGVEFDYCTVHAVQALRQNGIEAHVVNNNPETVSTDYDTSDGLFFEPITAEEVADVIEATGADGAMIQFGGQTSVDIGEPLEQEIERRGLDCEVLGTTVDAMDLAEDRDRFNQLMDELGIAQPEGGTATSEAEALDLAHEIGYPVLVRPSYVLGGRAMEVVGSDAELKEYIEEAVRVAPDKPILVDKFLEGGVELDVDAVSDGERVLIGGIMEHVESAGVHSGDSACMIPPRWLEADAMGRIREVTEEIARALDTVGLLNVQLAVYKGEVYVLEANPRSSRTVPFVSKATGVPIAKIAAQVMAGTSLEDIDVTEQIPEQTSVKEVVLPFDRLPGSDPRLGPEMKSTGEVMGTADSFGKAYWKAQQAAGAVLPRGGTAVIDLDVDGFEEFYEVKEFEDVPEAIREGKVDLVITRDRESLQTAVEEDVTYYSTAPSVQAALEALRARDDPLDVRAVSERPVREAEWGR